MLNETFSVISGIFSDTVDHSNKLILVPVFPVASVKHVSRYWNLLYLPKTLTQFLNTYGGGGAIVQSAYIQYASVSKYGTYFVIDGPWPWMFSQQQQKKWKFSSRKRNDYFLMFILYFSGVYEHIRNRASLSDTYPYFDATSERNVTSFVGQVTHLHCTVRDIGDRTVSQTKQKM